MKKFCLCTVIASLLVFTCVSAFAASIKNDKLSDFLYLCATSTYDEVALALDGQDKEATDEKGMTALMYAVHYNQETKIVQLLLEYGFSVNAVDNYGQTVLIHAMYLNDPVVIKMLLDNSADVNAAYTARGNKTALMHAAQYSNKLLVFELLIANGAQLEQEDIYGNTAFFYACAYTDNVAIVEYLLHEGAKINKVNVGKRTPLMLTAMNATKGPQIATILLQEGANIHVFDENMNTPLIYAAMYSDEVDLYKVLLAHGADVAFVNIAGYTALDYVKLNERSEEIYKLFMN